MDKVTLSVFKADVGGFVGHTGVHEDVLRRARELIQKAVSKGLLLDAWVGAVGDDLEVVATHERGSDAREIHKLAWDTFAVCTEVAERLKLHNPGQDLLAPTFTGHLRGLGPGYAEITFRERPSEPVVVFMADKCDLGAWNLPLYRMFADPFNTSGLLTDPSMHEGFAFELLDALEHRTITLQCPGDLYDLLMFLGSRGRFVVNKVIRRVDGVVAAGASAPRPAGTCESAGVDDPVLIVRCETGLPAVGEATEAFAFPHLVTGWMRNTHQGPLMPVPLRHARAVRFDGPPRVAAAGVQRAGGTPGGSGEPPGRPFRRPLVRRGTAPGGGGGRVPAPARALRAAPRAPRADGPHGLPAAPGAPGKPLRQGGPRGARHARAARAAPRRG